MEKIKKSHSLKIAITAIFIGCFPFLFCIAYFVYIILHRDELHGGGDGLFIAIISVTSYLLLLVTNLPAIIFILRRNESFFSMGFKLKLLITFALIIILLPIVGIVFFDFIKSLVFRV